MNQKFSPNRGRLFVLAGTALFSLGLMLAYPPRALPQSGLLADPTEQFNVFCDANGGGTGECNRLDNSELLSCELSSQDFIQCRSRQGYLANCLYYAPGQFACRKIADVRLNPRGECEDSLQSSSGCRQPLREKFTNPLTPLQKPDASTSPQPSYPSNPLKVPFPDTLRQ